MFFRNRRGPLPFVLTLVTCASFAASGPALATTKTASVYKPYPYSNCASPGDNFGTPICVAWTGGWPGGKVRAESPGTGYSDLRLDTCSSSGEACTDFHTVASKALDNYQGTTASVNPGKFAWFRVCSKTNHGGKWGCDGGIHEVYLGD